MPEPEVTVVVVTYRGRDLLPDCLDSLAAQTADHRLLVIDNASDDGSATILADRLAPDQVIRLTNNTGFAGGVAAALDQVRTRFVALLNDDAQADSAWLETLLRRAEAEDHQQRTAAWTSVMVHADRPSVVQNAGAGLLSTGYGVDLAAGEPVEAAGDAEVFGFCGGAALLRTDAVRAVGGFPAEFFLYYEDTDTSWRLRSAGWRIQRVPESSVRHAHSATSDQRSELFHRYNERNRLWCLVRNAPGRVVVGSVVRFTVTTGSLAVKQFLLHRRPAHPNLRVGLRVGALRELLGALPGLLAARRRSGRRSQVRRADIWQAWAGRVS